MRIKSSMVNLVFAITGQSLGLLISFFARIVFIQILGKEYLGLNGLFTNILSLLSLVELGIGPAITYSLYKPLAHKDISKVKSLMRLYKKAYITIGILILILGLLMMTFLEVFIKTIPDIPYIHLIFFLFVLNSAISYFYSYKRALIISDQKRYIATIYRYSFFILLNIIQIFMLYLTQNFILFLICQILVTLAENIVVSKKADKLYPYLKEKNIQKVDQETFKEITKNVRAMIAHKLGGVVVNSTDSIIISKFSGLVTLGVLSNYQLIINALNLITSQIFASITASVGNLGATESKEKSLDIFKVVFFINFWLYGFISISLVILINPFIELWIGKEFVLNISIIFVIILNFYLTGMRKSVLTFKEALGLYWYDRYKPLFEVFINLIASLILVQKFGMLGVFIGTTISTITTCFWIEPLVLYKYGFKSPVFPFFFKYFIYSLVTVSMGIFMMEVNGYFIGVTLLNFVVQLFICIFVINGMFLLLFYRTAEFKYLIHIANNLFIGLKKK